MLARREGGGGNRRKGPASGAFFAKVGRQQSIGIAEALQHADSVQHILPQLPVSLTHGNLSA